jgi:hypothetical protein
MARLVPAAILVFLVWLVPLRAEAGEACFEWTLNAHGIVRSDRPCFASMDECVPKQALCVQNLVPDGGWCGPCVETPGTSDTGGPTRAPPPSVGPRYVSPAFTPEYVEVHTRPYQRALRRLAARGEDLGYDIWDGAARNRRPEAHGLAVVEGETPAARLLRDPPAVTRGAEAPSCAQLRARMEGSRRVFETQQQHLVGLTEMARDARRDQQRVNAEIAAKVAEKLADYARKHLESLEPLERELARLQSAGVGKEPASRKATELLDRLTEDLRTMTSAEDIREGFDIAAMLQGGWETLEQLRAVLDSSGVLEEAGGQLAERLLPGIGAQIFDLTNFAIDLGIRVGHRQVAASELATHEESVMKLRRSMSARNRAIYRAQLAARDGGCFGVNDPEPPPPIGLEDP